MNNSEERWEDAATGLIKSALSLKGIKYPELARRLKMMGVDETPSSIGSKINRGTYKATFLLQVLQAIEMQHITIPDIK